MSTVGTRGLLITLALLSLSGGIHLRSINRTYKGKVQTTNCLNNVCYSIIKYNKTNGTEAEIQLETGNHHTLPGSKIILEYNKNYPEQVNACCRRKNLEKFLFILGGLFFIAGMDLANIFSPSSVISRLTSG